MKTVSKILLVVCYLLNPNTSFNLNNVPPPLVPQNQLKEAQSLYDAAIEGKIDYLKTRLSSGVDIDDKSGSLRSATAMHAAAERNNTEIIEFLISAGAIVNSRDKRGMTPLHNASEWGQLEACRILIESGAKVNSTDIHLRTPLHIATSMGEIKAIYFLLKHGAKIGAKDINGFTPLSIAVFIGNIECVKSLLSSGAKLSTIGHHEETALHLAVLIGHKEMVEFLLAGNKVDATNKTISGLTPKEISQEWARSEITSIFENNINITKTDKIYSSFSNETIVPVGNFHAWEMPLIQICEIYSNWNKRVLIQRKKPLLTQKSITFELQKPITVKAVCGALLYKIYIAGYTPIPIGKSFLVLAENNKMFDSSSQILDELILDSRNAAQNTALHDAVSIGNYPLVKLLVESGAKINSKNFRGKTPLDTAAKSKKISDYLLKEGAEPSEALKVEIK